MPRIVTANHLRSGAVVYLTREGNWVSILDRATPAFTDVDFEHLKSLALAAAERNEVTAIYAFEARIVADRPEPLSVREQIRAAQAASTAA
jgi:hypothetical protein